MPTTQQHGLSLEEKVLNKYHGDIDRIAEILKSVANRQSKKKTKQHTYGDIIVQLEAVSKTYKVGRQKVHALNNISLSIRQGEYVALTGPSGSGKSTLLQLIGALDKPSTGKIHIDNKDIARLSDTKLSVFRNTTIGFVFQFFYLQPFLNLQTNLEVPGMFARTKVTQRRNKAKELSADVGLTDRLTHLPSELSGGQMQRAAIARALLNKPKILLADEPTGNLDRTNAFAIMDVFDQMREKYGTTIIVVTHDPGLAQRADREIKLQDGTLQ